jgi:protein N-terminal amidase
MQNDENRLNVLLVQYCPSFKDIDASIKKLEQLLSKFNKSHLIDIIVLPEMALTGYNFDCKEEIKDCLEEYNKGKTYEFCANLSRR